MNETLFVILAIFLPFFLLSQIRFFRRLIRLKKRYDNISGVLLLSDLTICCCNICACIDDSVVVGEVVEIHEQRVKAQRRREKVARTRTGLRLSEIESGKSVDGLTKDNKENEIKKLVSNKQKTSLQWISTKKRFNNT